MAAISEKDANIALLELSSSKKKKTQDEVALLKREKDRLVQQLKQQVNEGLSPTEGKNRMKTSQKLQPQYDIRHNNVIGLQGFRVWLEERTDTDCQCDFPLTTVRVITRHPAELDVKFQSNMSLA